MVLMMKVIYESVCDARRKYLTYGRDGSVDPKARIVLEGVQIAGPFLVRFRIVTLFDACYRPVGYDKNYVSDTLAIRHC